MVDVKKAKELTDAMSLADSSNPYTKTAQRLTWAWLTIGTIGLSGLMASDFLTHGYVYGEAGRNDTVARELCLEEAPSYNFVAEYVQKKNELREEPKQIKDIALLAFSGFTALGTTGCLLGSLVYFRKEKKYSEEHLPEALQLVRAQKPPGQNLN